jgi:hypothetical protein
MTEFLTGDPCVALQTLDLCGLPTLRGIGAVHGQRPQLPPSRGVAVAGNPPAGEAERALRQIKQNFTELTHTVPMIDIEDMPIPMQRYMVGLPRTWVRLFRRLGRAVHDYNRAHRP